MSLQTPQEAPPETVTRAMRSVPLTYAQDIVISHNQPPVFEADALKLWHVRFPHLGPRFLLTVVISDQGATLACEAAMQGHMDALIAADMENMPRLTPTRH